MKDYGQEIDRERSCRIQHAHEKESKHILNCLYRLRQAFQVTEGEGELRGERLSRTNNGRLRDLPNISAAKALIQIQNIKLLKYSRIRKSCQLLK